MRTRRAVWIGAAACFVAAFMGLRAYSVPRRSATFDEPVHLTAGYAAIANGDFTVDITHPPLLRMAAALPLWWSATPPVFTASPPGAAPSTIVIGRKFLFGLKDADTYLARGRLVVAGLGALLGLLVAAWAYEWRGPAAAVVAAACYLLIPTIAAHAELITTDLGATTFIFAGVYATWRLTRRFTRSRVLVVAAAASLAVVTKFSGVILAPIMVTLLIAAVARRQLNARQASIAVAAALVMSVASIWACYGFRYQPTPKNAALFEYDHDPGIRAAAPALSAIVGWIDGHHLLPNAFSEGLLYSQVAARNVPVYTMGRVRSGTSARAIALTLFVKTPLPMLLLAVIGLIVCGWRGGMTGLSIMTPMAMYVWAALAGGVTLGVRHLLPLYPFLTLAVVAGIQWLWSYAPARLGRANRLGAAAAAVTLVFWTMQFARSYPNTLTFFSSAIGGADRGAAYLADSDLDWGQHLKLLKRWMDRNHVPHINLAYFGSADPAYYGISYTRLPSQSLLEPRTSSLPALPGFVAVSATAQAGVYLPPEWRLFYEGLSTQTPVASIGHTIRVYWLEQWPEAPKAAAPAGTRLDAMRALARKLVDRGWVDLGLSYYARYAARRDTDVNALEEMGAAAAVAGRDRRAAQWLKRAVELDPQRSRASQLLATVLLRQHDVPGALAEARRAAGVSPLDPAAHDLLGRALAAAGSLVQAADEFRRALRLDPAFDAASLGLRLVEAALRAEGRLLLL